MVNILITFVPCGNVGPSRNNEVLRKETDRKKVQHAWNKKAAGRDGKMARETVQPTCASARLRKINQQRIYSCPLMRLTGRRKWKTLNVCGT